MKTPKPSRPTAQQPALFEASSPDPVAATPPRPPGLPRVRRAERFQIVFRAGPLDALISEDHPARIVWHYVEGLDLSSLYHPIQAVQGRPGRPPIDPKILLALWLYATIEGVGSARRLDELCRVHAAFQWIAGDVSTNYHTLADFRVDHPELLDGLLTQGVAALLAEGLVDLNRVAQDGMRVRADAGAASFRRRPTLEEALQTAEAQLAALRAEAQADPALARRRHEAARVRAAAERAERIKAALGRLPELEAKRKEAEKAKARCSTTDPEATVMKMADGGFRPAYNFQFATDTTGQIVVGVDVVTTGSDAGQMTPMVDQIIGRHGVKPEQYLVDGGFVAHHEIDAMAEPSRGSVVYMPVPELKHAAKGPHEVRPSDSEAVGAWRQRMATDQAKAIYKNRAATAECVNALARQRGLTRLVVRGRVKVKAIALWHALAHNLMRAVDLRAMAALRAGVSMAS